MSIKPAIFFFAFAFLLAHFSAYGVKLRCDFDSFYDNGYTCWIQLASVQFEDEPVNIVGRSQTNPMTEVRIMQSQTVYIIKEIFDKFPELTRLEVSESGLKQITPNVFRNASKLERLEIEGNEVETLRAGALNGLVALRKLFITNSKVVHIEVGALAGLQNLSHLNFEGNLIENLHEDIFVGLSILEILDFQRNRIKFLPTKLFHPLRKLKQIFFFYNQITRLDNDMFLENGANVQRLEFYVNKINFVGPRFFDNLVKLDFVNFETYNCLNDDYNFWSRWNYNNHSSFLTKIRAAFSTCFNNFDDEPATTTTTQVTDSELT